MKKLILSILFCVYCVLEIQGQEANLVLSGSQPSGTVSEATNSINLLPGFFTNGNYHARIVEENGYDEVIGTSYNLTENLNWISSSSYDLSGNLTSSGVSYFNSLGKGTQSHSLDIKTGKIWVNEVRYDAFGRPVFSTLSAPVGDTYGFRSGFIEKTNGSTLSAADIQNLTGNSSTISISDTENTLGWYYSEKNDSEAYQDVTDYPFSKVIHSTLNPGLGLRTLGGNKVKRTTSSREEWLQSYSFSMPMAQELFYAFGKNEFPERDLVVEADSSSNTKPTNNSNVYYIYRVQENCNGLIYEDVRFFSNWNLKIGSIYKMSIPISIRSTNQEEPALIEQKSGYFEVLSRTTHTNNNGDDIFGEFEIGNSTAGNINNLDFIELEARANLLDTKTAYLCPKGRPYYIQGNKTIVRDVNGVESVIFKDSDGNVLAAARSGNEDNATRKKYKVTSTIGAQGYVDIHIPVGCSNIRLVGGTSGEATNITIYNLITDQPVSNAYTNSASKTFSLVPGMYRVQENSNYHKKENPYVTINTSSINLLDTSKNIGVTYDVNYYDYSLNYYDKAGRLTSSVQPLGFDATLDLSTTRNHKLISTFSYNTLGQLLDTESPDEGEAKFKYRKDGQIRFSQNSKQDLKTKGATGEFSYTNYDPLGRPIESGVASGAFDASLDADIAIFSNTALKEQNFTVYDEIDTTLETKLTVENIPTAKYRQQFIAGNVSKTYTQNPQTTTTWYSYDVYGRVTWMVQDITGLGIKTIDYQYDFATGQVTKVLYQKNVQDETFVHKYTYNIAGELYKVATSIDNQNFTEQAKYKYYETGALKRVEIAENVQGIDYVYNLNGQLKAINHPSTSTSEDPGKDGTNGMAKDLFGFALDYYNGDYSRTNTPTPVTSTTQGTNQFNGNIKATRWATKQLNSNNQSAQVYTYNKNNWLQQADFGSAQNNGQISVGNDYKVSTISYDINGNIKTLNRNKDTQNGSNAMDDFTYHYKTDKPNQLDRVEDAVTTATNADDLKSQNTENYIYNEIGQLIENKQDNIKYIYNASGLVTKILHNNDLKVKFSYNDKGFRVKKESYTGNYSKTTFYVRDAAGSPMAIVNMPVGKTTRPPTIEHPIYGASRLGVYKKASNTSIYQFTDHLGNVRATALKTPQSVVSLSGATDYYPFGMPMPNRQIVGGEPYRYAFQGQEKDPETGKEAFQLRLWDGRIGRWLTTDPYGQYSSPYLGMGNDPINGIDPDGGYRTWAGAFLGWFGSGFKGSIDRVGGGGDKEFAISNYVAGNGALDSEGFFIMGTVQRDYGSNFFIEANAGVSGGPQFGVDLNLLGAKASFAGDYKSAKVNVFGGAYSSKKGFYNNTSDVSTVDVMQTGWSVSPVPGVFGGGEEYYPTASEYIASKYNGQLKSNNLSIIGWGNFKNDYNLSGELTQTTHSWKIGADVKIILVGFHFNLEMGYKDIK